MSYACKLHAKKAAKKTLARMTTFGWSMLLSICNEKWEYKLVNGNLTLSSSIDDDKNELFFCMLTVYDDWDGGEYFWCDDCNHENPNAAVTKQIHLAEEFLKDANECLNTVKGSLNTKPKKEG